MTADRLTGGVLHVGGHRGDEIALYRALGLDPIVFVEPLPAYARELRRKGVEVIEAAASDTEGEYDFYVGRFDQASSLLQPLEHEVAQIIRVRCVRLAPLMCGRFGLVVIDVQGAELKVLCGCDLTAVEKCVIETSVVPRYQGGATATEIADHMRAQGFVRAAAYQHEQYDIWDEVYTR